MNLSKLKDSLINLEKRIVSLKTTLMRLENKRNTDEEEDYIELSIKRFESADEVAKKLMQRYLEYQGEKSNLGAKSLFREIARYGFIDSDTWFSMNEDRNKTAHEYDESFAKALVLSIKSSYILLIEDFYNQIKEFVDSE